ncbi:MAG: hypothetical protein J6W07_03990, partial [Bacteroidales bacterium]|nr:hypothetical protein [Bacteroidales bacterium]
MLKMKNLQGIVSCLIMLTLAPSTAGAQPFFRRQAVTVTVAPDAPDWENPNIIGINKEPYHATLDLPCSIADRSDVMTL